MEYEQVVFEVEDGVATLTLNRPGALNAWNERMALEVEQAPRALRRGRRRARRGADGRRPGVLRRRGSLRGGRQLPAGDGAAPSRGSDRESEPLRPCQMTKPVVAAINGHAIGVGITLPLTCDVRFVAEDAKLQFAFVRRGVIPELASHAILPRVVGFSRAADLLLSGRIFSGREAAALGLAPRAARGEVLPAALA